MTEIQAGLYLMLYGIGGVFAVLILFYFVIRIITKVLK